MPLLLIFILVPVIEIALFIQVGSWLGMWPTLVTVILTAIVGTYLLRLQGIAELIKLQNAMRGSGSPIKPIANGALILVAGVLLLTPGFFTDFLGFILLTPPIRGVVIEWLSSYFTKNPNVVFTRRGQSNNSENQPKDTDAVDADYIILDDEDSKKPGNSGWTKRD
ncbi:MAG: FxsA family protein [Amylibacter sp.]|nr:FxsA family protein [Amylibacter sp.]